MYLCGLCLHVCEYALSFFDCVITNIQSIGNAPGWTNAIFLEMVGTLLKIQLTFSNTLDTWKLCQIFPVQD